MKTLLYDGPLQGQIVEVPDNQNFYDAVKVTKSSGRTVTRTLLYCAAGYASGIRIFAWEES